MSEIKYNSDLINDYEKIISRVELYGQIKEGLDDASAGNTRPFSEAMFDIRSRHKKLAE